MQQNKGAFDLDVLQQLTTFSNRFGANPELVLAGGGNTSAKKDGILYVKGSGTALSTITAQDFVQLDLPQVLRLFANTYPAEDDAREAAVLADLMAARLPGQAKKRPSVETPLHALFPQTYVLHLHPALVNGLTCAKGAEHCAREVLQTEFVWIDSCRPGYILSKTCREALAAYRQATGKDAQVVLLQNHGIFLAADDPARLEVLLRAILDDLQNALTQTPAAPDETPGRAITAACEALRPLFSQLDSWIPLSGGSLGDFCKSRKSAAALLSPFTPDHIVYCKAKFLFLEDIGNAQTAIAAFQKENGYLPQVILVAGAGALCRGAQAKQAHSCRLLLEDAAKIAVYTQSFGGPLPLSEELVDFIVHWEVESYRSAQNAATI